MRFLLSITLTAALSAPASAQTMPIGYADLGPAAQVRLEAEWKKNYRADIPALPPGQKAEPKGEPKSVALPPPKAAHSCPCGENCPLYPACPGGDSCPCAAKAKAAKAAMPATGVLTYAEWTERVKAGERVRAEIVHPKAGVAVVLDAPASLAAGTWDGYKENGQRFVVRVTGGSGSVATAPALGPDGLPHWTYPGEIRHHLVNEHRIPQAVVDGLTDEQCKTLHDHQHDPSRGVAQRPAAPSPQQSPQPYPQQGFGQINGYMPLGGAGGCPTCPSGRCPVPQFR